MKKHLRFAFAAVLVLALMIPALAMSALAYTETLVGTGTSVVDIEVEYRAATDNRDEIASGAESTRVYRVTLEWEPSGKIVYNAGKTVYSWNGDALKYDSEVTGKGWTVLDAKLTVIARNRSNRPVDVTCAEPEMIGDVKMTGSYDRSTVEVPSAATGGLEGVGTEQIGKIVYTVDTVSGDISSTTENIAGITVTVIGK